MTARRGPATARRAAGLALEVLLAGCGRPEPPDKADYAGQWEHPTMQLLTTQDGSVRYKRLQQGVSKSITGPLQGFEGDNFAVGVGPMPQHLGGLAAAA